MPVVSVQANTVVVPLEVPPAISTRALLNREYTLVRIENSEGQTGYGFCYGGSKAGHISTIAVRDLLREHVIGKETGQMEEIWDDMYRDSLLHGRRGLVLRAISAIDNALWDLYGKEKGMPLYMLLGSEKKETVPAYASGGYYINGKTNDDLANEVKGYVDSGFKAVKIKVGMLSAWEEALRVKACREAIGPDIPLYLDANNAWPDVVTAMKSIRLFEEYNPGWVEEPVLPSDLKASAEIASLTEIPIATGEIEATRWGFEEIIYRKAASILQTDAAVCGGITEWLKITDIARASNIPIAPHWFADLHAHLVATDSNVKFVEFFTDTSILNFMRLLTKSIKARDGELILPQEPGLGIEFREDLVEKLSIDGWR
ncbi:mandelate racemase/muconate lactonizing enzyme family protein [Chloroflexota bacterium]